MPYFNGKVKNNVKNKAKNIEVTKAASIVAFVTFFSRITGYIRDMFFASFFGVGMISDAFIIAFRIPNLFRRLLGEGSLNLVFIPIFTQYFTKGSYTLAYRLAENSLRFLFIFLVILSLIGVTLTPLLLKLIAPGFNIYPLKMDLAIKLTRIMFPYIVFVGTSALCMGILNVFGSFAVPAFAPILLNMSMIIFLYTSKLFYFNEISLIIGLSISVLFGGCFQLLIQLPLLAKNGIHLFKNYTVWHPEFKQIGYALLPTLFASTVYQINTIIISILASFLPEGSVASLYYADRIVQFPLGIFAYAIATAALPSLSKHKLSKSSDSLESIVEHTVTLLFFITIPAMAGLIVLRQSIVNFIFGRGMFSCNAVLSTSDSLLCYAVGLWAVAAVKLLVPVFFVLKDTIAPAKIAILSIIINTCFGLLLMQFWGHCGLALATSIASILNLLLLILNLSRKLPNISWINIFSSIFKTIFCTTLMVIFVVSLKKIIIPSLNMGRIYLTIGLFSCIIAGIFIFMFLAFVIKMPQLHQILFLLGISKKTN